jgi:hypothetical protein
MCVCVFLLCVMETIGGSLLRSERLNYTRTSSVAS